MDLNNDYWANVVQLGQAVAQQRKQASLTPEKRPTTETPVVTTTNSATTETTSSSDRIVVVCLEDTPLHAAFPTPTGSNAIDHFIAYHDNDTGRRSAAEVPNSTAVNPTTTSSSTTTKSPERRAVQKVAKKSFPYIQKLVDEFRYYNYQATKVRVTDT